MAIAPLERLKAIKFWEEKATQGSAPLLLTGSDDQEYIAKTCPLKVPRVELINELLCAYMLQCWQLEVPPFKLMQIDFHLVEGKLSSRYQQAHFDTPFFASQLIAPTLEMADFIKGLTAQELKQFSNPEDLLKIGCFDLWVGNRDRKPDNMNLLLSQQSKRIHIHPIDHTAAFAYCTNHRDVREAILHLNDSSSILTTSLVKSVYKQQTESSFNKVKHEISQSIENTLYHLDDIYAQIPTDWGFSKKAKAHIKEFLADGQRNSKILGRLETLLR